GYSSVINLAPHHAENSLTDEALLVEQLGLKYTHIPVDFKNPTNEDFEKFIILMGESKSEKTWIHCAANMRVSAFIYKYRLEVLNHDAKQAEIDLKKIWEPYGVWKQFIKKANG
ncbi:MAG: protein tyrosine phosphatase family protein, partial [Sinobacterium sp.]